MCSLSSSKLPLQLTVVVKLIPLASSVGKRHSYLVGSRSAPPSGGGRLWCLATDVICSLILKSAAQPRSDCYRPTSIRVSVQYAATLPLPQLLRACCIQHTSVAELPQPLRPSLTILMTSHDFPVRRYLHHDNVRSSVSLHTYYMILAAESPSASLSEVCTHTIVVTRYTKRLLPTYIIADFLCIILTLCVRLK
jgi:hypothetical protein